MVVACHNEAGNGGVHSYVANGRYVPLKHLVIGVNLDFFECTLTCPLLVLEIEVGRLVKGCAKCESSQWKGYSFSEQRMYCNICRFLYLEHLSCPFRCVA